MSRIIAVMAIFSISFALGCASVQEALVAPKVTSQSTQTVAEKEAYTGPKVPIAVSMFPIKTGAVIRVSDQRISYSQISEGMNDMLVTTLAQTNMFTVLERERLNEVMLENQIEGKEKENIKSARYIIAGAITGYEESQASVGAGAKRGAIYGGVWGAAVGAASEVVKGAIQQSYIAVDVRIIDTKTSEVMWTQSLKATPKDLSGAIGGMFGSTLAGMAGHYNTPIAKAQRALAIMIANGAGEAFADYTEKEKVSKKK